MVQHQAVVLFYRYFIDQSFDPHDLQTFCSDLCQNLELKGRLLISEEGINGTVSATTEERLRRFIASMESYEQRDGMFPFAGIDWKVSTTKADDTIEPFPDMKVRWVPEIISTGGSVSVQDIPIHGGTHLSPQEFHHAMSMEDAVLIDVRNTFEHEIGHFIHPSTQTPAMNPETVTFSSFEDTFCAKNIDALKDKKVLMYCTGGIRCEKASVMLKRLGVSDVSQLNGGIHRYLETYGEDGYFRGKNFVFDQRVAQTPAECKGDVTAKAAVIVGSCLECGQAFDELCGSRICAVCRDLVLICADCERTLREYHCKKHLPWKHCYFTFLEPYSRKELRIQQTELERLLAELPSSRNVRRTLAKQIEKVKARIVALDNATAVYDPHASKRCRSCMEPRTKCDGRCWGFWKKHVSVETVANEGIIPISIGDTVEPGPDWNEIRFGIKTTDNGCVRCGEIIELKTWSAGSTERDCAVVRWENGTEQIYRWGALTLDGSRIYELQHSKVN